MSIDNVRKLRETKVPLACPIDADSYINDLLPDGDLLDRRVTFRSAVWDLAGHPDFKDKVGRDTKIDFTAIPDRWQTLTKLWVLASINPSIVQQWCPPDSDDPAMWKAFKEPVKASSAKANVKALRMALTRFEANKIVEVDADGWDHITKLMRLPLDRGEVLEHGKRLAATTCKLWANQLRSVHTFGRVVGWDAPFGSAPWDDTDLGTVFPTSNYTPGGLKLNSIRPHEAVGHILGVAAFVIDHCADDIIAHTAWWVGHHLDAKELCPASRDEGKDVVTDLLRDVAASNGGRLPAAPGVTDPDSENVCHSALAYLVGYDGEDRKEPHQWGRQAVRNVRRINGSGPADLLVNPCPLPLKALPHVDTAAPTPWTPRLLWHRSELHWWITALLYSCMYYLNATLGLRDGDRALLSPGCVTTRTITDDDGIPVVVHDLKVYKQKQRRAPVPTTVAVGSRIARVIDIVERLHDAMQITPAPQADVAGTVLFDSRLNLGSVRTVDSGTRAGLYLDGGFMTHFRGMASRLKDAGVVPRDLDGVPDVREKSIRITAMQAWAARPLGAALTAAYGQWQHSRVMGGYTGDVIKQIVLADPDDAGVFAQAHIGLSLRRAADELDALGGNGIPRLKEALSRLPELTNGEPLTLARAQRVGGRQANWETGPYTACLFNPDGALCGGHGSADWRLCRPGECRNSVMTAADRARLELRRRKHEELSPILRRDADKIAAGVPEVVAEFANTSNDELVSIITAEADEYLRQAIEIGMVK